MAELANSTDHGSEQPRVLIVQPKRDYLSLMARRMAEGGYRVATADSAAVAMAELHRQKIDLILSELRMKGCGGVELVHMVRDDPAHREIPIFLITGRTDKSGAIDAYRSGADAVIAKPYHFEVLLARIGRDIERSRTLEKLRADNAALDARVIGRALEVGEIRDRLIATEAERQRLESLIARR